MAGETDDLVRAGEGARVVVEVSGTDDGNAAAVLIYLRMLGWENKRAFRWPLGEVPPQLGRHELEVELPGGLAPACVRLAEYSFCAELKVREGLGVTAAADVDVVARPEDLHWPEGPRSEGELTLDADVVALGATVSGRAAPGAQVEVGPTLDRTVGLPGATAAPRFEPAGTATAAEDGRFTVALPADGVPPTLYDGSEIAVVWEVRAGDAWARLGVLDPEARAGRRAGRTPALLTCISKLAGDRLF